MINAKTMISFIATGVAGTATSITASGQNPILSGDPIIEIVDITAGGPVTQFFGTVAVDNGSGSAFIVELLNNPGIAGHICLALIGQQ